MLELGTNHPGEIASLARIAMPNVALVNNAQREHQAYFDGAMGSALENASVFAWLSGLGTHEHLPSGVWVESPEQRALGQQLYRQGVAIFPYEDPCSQAFDKFVKMRGLDQVLCFSSDAAKVHDGLGAGGLVLRAVKDQGSLDISKQSFWVSTRADRAARFEISGLGSQAVHNALAAVACAWSLGLSFESLALGLSRYVNTPGRMQPMVLPNGTLLLNDTYNANPDSVLAAIDALRLCPGPRWLILGEMGEVGEQGPKFHAEVGVYAATQGVQHLWTLGEGSESAVHAFVEHAVDEQQAEHFQTKTQLEQAFLRVMHQVSSDQSPLVGTVLIKGSRFMQIESLLQVLDSSVLESQRVIQH